MQTFLPFPDYSKSAAVLDQQRLGKQRVETLQVLQALSGRKLEGTKIPHPDNPLKTIDAPESEWYTIEYWPKGWTNHPVAHMWRNHLRSLLDYQYAVCHEWTVVRGHRDTCLAKSRLIMRDSGLLYQPADTPFWFGDDRFHLSHRANLVAKKPEFYADKFPDVDLADLRTMPYLWPKALYGEYYSLDLTKADIKLVASAARVLPLDLTYDPGTGAVSFV